VETATPGAGTFLDLGSKNNQCGILTGGNNSRWQSVLESFNMKRKQNSDWPPPEIEAVLKASPNLKPCEEKYGRIPYDQFLEHIGKDRCVQCRDLLLQLEKQLKMMEYLRLHKN
jgi:hypothetical protein